MLYKVRVYRKTHNRGGSTNTHKSLTCFPLFAAMKIWLIASQLWTLFFCRIKICKLLWNVINFHNLIDRSDVFQCNDCYIFCKIYHFVKIKMCQAVLMTMYWDLLGIGVFHISAEVKVCVKENSNFDPYFKIWSNTFSRAG